MVIIESVFLRAGLAGSKQKSWPAFIVPSQVSDSNSCVGENTPLTDQHNNSTLYTRKESQDESLINLRITQVVY